jgi:hypothetical protein
VQIDGIGGTYLFKVCEVWERERERERENSYLQFLICECEMRENLIYYMWIK